MPVTQVAKKNGVSDATIYTWRKRFGEMEVNDVRDLKQLEQENGRLKKLLAERDLEIEVMKEVSLEEPLSLKTALFIQNSIDSVKGSNVESSKLTGLALKVDQPSLSTKSL